MPAFVTRHSPQLQPRPSRRIVAERQIEICGDDHVKIEKDEITIRDFTESDLSLMFQWLTDQRVLEYYEGRDVKFTMDTSLHIFWKQFPMGSE